MEGEDGDPAFGTTVSLRRMDFFNYFLSLDYCCWSMSEAVDEFGDVSCLKLEAPPTN